MRLRLILVSAALSAAPPEALAAARNWSAAWVNHPPGTTNARWTAGMRPFTTDEYLGVLAAVDPANVPATAVTGPPKPTRVAPRQSVSRAIGRPTAPARSSVERLRAWCPPGRSSA